MKAFVGVVSVVMMLLASAASAQNVQEPAADDWQPVVQTAESEEGPAILDLLGKLTIAVLVAWGLSWGVRWLYQQGGTRNLLPGHSTENRELRLDEVLPLGADGRLYLVTVSGQRILLAAREGSIERINLDEATDEPTTVYRTITQRPAAPPDEINISHSRLSTRPVRDDVITDSASWAERRDKLLRQLQDA